MHMRRRAAAAVLALPLALLAACGDDDEPGGSTDTTVAGTDATGTDATDTDTTATGEAATEEVLTVYSGRDPELVEEIIDLFEEETGIRVFTRYGSSAEMGAQLLEEGERTPADVFYSQEVGAAGVLARAGLLTELPQATIDRVAPRFQPGEENLWVGVTGRSRVIAYNPATLESLGLEVPTGVLDLTDPSYAGHVGWVPDNAGFQAFVTGFRVSQGEDAVRAWLEAMVANGAERVGSNGVTLAAVEAGEKPIGLINHYYWAQAGAEAGDFEGQAARLVFPAGDDPGGLVNATAVGITTRGADNPAALLFVDFLLSDAVQALIAETLLEYPVVPGVPGPDAQSDLIPALDDLEGPDLDLTDLDDLEGTQALLRELGLIE